MKKKILILFISILCMTGCGDVMNTPTKQVEQLFAKYQKVDNDISNELDTMLATETFTDTQKKDYRDIITNQYKNLTYTIKDEVVNGDMATVTTEIEVVNYKDIVDKLDNEYSTKTEYDTDAYTSEKISRLKKANDKVKYTLDIMVTKDANGNWKITNLTDTDIKKIQGMY